MTTSKARADWNGNLREGSGRLTFASGVFEGPYSFKTRTEGGGGQTTPEELIAAAHAGCYTMALSGALTKNNTPPVTIHTDAAVHLAVGAGGLTIDKITLTTRAKVPGLDNAKFQDLAKTTKETCPVSRALAAVPIELQATLEQ